MQMTDTVKGNSSDDTSRESSAQAAPLSWEAFFPTASSLLQAILTHATHIRPTSPLGNPTCSSLPFSVTMATPAFYEIISASFQEERLCKIHQYVK